MRYGAQIAYKIGTNLTHCRFAFNNITKRITLVIFLKGVEFFPQLGGSVIIAMRFVHNLPVTTNIGYGWAGTQLRFEYRQGVLGSQLGNFAIGIIHIAKDSGSPHAGLYTSR